LGDGQEHGDDPAWDAIEADALYDLFEREVVPQFYTRDASGIPTAWVKRMRESMAQLAPRFSSNRTGAIHRATLPSGGSTGYHARSLDQGAFGKQIVDWQHAVDQKWGSLRFAGSRIETNADHHVIEVQLFLNGLDPRSVRVELYTDAVNGADPVREEMKWTRMVPDPSPLGVYHATLPTTGPASNYTARVLSQHAGVSVPLECSRIQWQR
jgi:starch phosphorylase